MNSFQRFLVTPGFALLSLFVFLIRLFNYKFSIDGPIAVYISYILGLGVWLGTLIGSFYNFQISLILAFCFLTSSLVVKVD